MWVGRCRGSSHRSWSSSAPVPRSCPKALQTPQGSTLSCCRPSARKLLRGLPFTLPSYHCPASQAPSALSSCERLKELLLALALTKQYKILNEDFGLSVQDVSNIILDASCIVFHFPGVPHILKSSSVNTGVPSSLSPCSQPLRLFRPDPYPERQGVFALQADATLVSDL